MQRKIINLILMQKVINLTPILREVIHQQIKNIPLFQSYYDVKFHFILEFYNYFFNLNKNFNKKGLVFGS
jgi:hypothetical protein